MYEFEMAQQRIADLHEEARRVRLADDVAPGDGSHRRFRRRWRGRQRRAATFPAARDAQPSAGQRATGIPGQRRPAELAGRQS